MNKETLRMQMLAGVITESQYKTQLNESETSYDIDYNKLKQILLLACKTYTEEEDAIYTKSDIQPAIKYIMILDKGVKEQNEDVFDKLEAKYIETLENFVFLDDIQQQLWEEFDSALNNVSTVSGEYDLDEAAQSLNDLAQAINNFTL
jgi:hypothetical protein